MILLSVYWCHNLQQGLTHPHSPEEVLNKFMVVVKLGAPAVKFKTNL